MLSWHLGFFQLCRVLMVNHFPTNGVIFNLRVCILPQLFNHSSGRKEMQAWHHSKSLCSSALPPFNILSTSSCPSTYHTSENSSALQWMNDYYLISVRKIHSLLNIEYILIFMLIIVALLSKCVLDFKAMASDSVGNLQLVSASSTFPIFDLWLQQMAVAVFGNLHQRLWY